MCGIFGFALQEQIEMSKVFKILQKLETHQYLSEPRPVGGYGAGVAILNDYGTVSLEKIGKTADSPTKELAEICSFTKASVLIGHVRMPSPEFVETARFKETAQPYVVKCYSESAVVCAHNGKVKNYMEIKNKLGAEHVFESEKVELIDSEVIPHLFEEIIHRKNGADSLETLFNSLEGSNTTVLLQVDRDNAFLHFLHKGKTRGLTVWTNDTGELIFCSRKEPLKDEFEDVLEGGKFKELVSIRWQQEKSFKSSFCIK
jgi:glucosamine 6-phosphate synthetase-like amidotransferase/phosphosugar isomerase protein